MQVEIFFGMVYYQRLRHMVADKFQVRWRVNSWEKIQYMRLGARYGPSRRTNETTGERPQARWWYTLW